MADKKISALTDATTPLAGTEVLPIVQNNSTVKVSVNNLTAGKAVSALNQTISGNVTTVAFNAATAGQLFSGGTNATKYTGTVYQGANSWNTFIGRIPDAVGDNVAIGNDALGSYGNVVVFGVNDVTVSRGNLIQGTAAKGINFTANTGAAGMTSQLLNWYEEGDWTPAQGGGLTVVGTFSSTGRYTRIGRQVTVTFTLSGSTSVAINGGGGVVTNNLPFTAGSYSAGSVAVYGASSSSIFVDAGTKDVYSTTAVAAASTIILSLIYFV